MGRCVRVRVRHPLSETRPMSYLRRELLLLELLKIEGLHLGVPLHRLAARRLRRRRRRLRRRRAQRHRVVHRDTPPRRRGAALAGGVRHVRELHRVLAEGLQQLVAEHAAVAHLEWVDVEVEVVVEVDAGCTLAGIALCAFAATMQSPSAILSNARDVGARRDVWASVEDDAMLLVMVASGGSSCEGRGANARSYAKTMCAGFVISTALRSFSSYLLRRKCFFAHFRAATYLPYLSLGSNRAELPTYPPSA